MFVSSSTWQRWLWRKRRYTYESGESSRWLPTSKVIVQSFHIRLGYQIWRSRKAARAFFQIRAKGIVLLGTDKMRLSYHATCLFMSKTFATYTFSIHTPTCKWFQALELISFTLPEQLWDCTIRNGYPRRLRTPILDRIPDTSTPNSVE